ncbi:hypothetical protein J6590_089761 [Homalodisca vitripennis]|nr:hypothetical protein J6590_089761 [Homalodisca vitripennis]
MYEQYQSTFTIGKPEFRKPTLPVFPDSTAFKECLPKGPLAVLVVRACSELGCVSHLPCTLKLVVKSHPLHHSCCRLIIPFSIHLKFPGKLRSADGLIVDYVREDTRYEQNQSSFTIGKHEFRKPSLPVFPDSTAFTECLPKGLHLEYLGKDLRIHSCE